MPHEPTAVPGMPLVGIARPPKARHGQSQQDVGAAMSALLVLRGTALVVEWTPDEQAKVCELLDKLFGPVPWVPAKCPVQWCDWTMTVPYTLVASAIAAHGRGGHPRLGERDA